MTEDNVLDLVSTDDILTELATRCDQCVVILHRTNPGDNEHTLQAFGDTGSGHDTVDPDALWALIEAGFGELIDDEMGLDEEPL